MKISFICGSLAPGKDGVGDYVRRLSEKMVELGWKCFCISLNDTEEVIDMPLTNNAGLPRVNYCRIKESSDIGYKKELLSTALTLFKPDICSLQLVVYSFHPRGWMREFNVSFAPILAKYKTHLMWHELWIGQLSNSTLKEKIEGFWQKKQIFQLLQIIRPRLQHTSVAFYQALLRKQKIDVKLLPLFSNFSLDRAENFDLKEKLNLIPSEPVPLLLVSFGTIYKHFPFEQWLKDAIDWSKHTGRSIILCSIGKTGTSSEIWREWEKYTIAHGIDKIKLHSLGVLSPSEIQSIFASAEAGLSLTPFEAWGKSGAIAAMHESGLPIIIYEFGISTFDFVPESTNGLINFKINTLNKWPLKFERHIAQNKLPQICEKFIADLETIIS